MRRPRGEPPPGPPPAPWPTPRANPLFFGHEAAVAEIEAALHGPRLHHAWLIGGPEGVGKATLAFRLARAVLAGQRRLEVPETHPVARRVAAGSHADLLTIERQWDPKRGRLQARIAAEEARLVTPFLRRTAAEGGWRCVIVDGAEDLNAASANALLKILEEPPPGALLLLISAAPGRLLPTLRSRCRRLRLSTLDPPEMDRAMAALLPQEPPDRRARLALLSGGAPGIALRLSEGPGLAIASLADTVLEGLPRLPYARRQAVVDGVAAAEEEGFALFVALLRRRLAEAVIGQARGGGDALLSLRPPAAWGEAWRRLGEIEAETLGFFLDRRESVLAVLRTLEAG